MKFVCGLLSIVILLNSPFALADAADDEIFGSSPHRAKNEPKVLNDTTTFGGRISVDSGGTLKEDQKVSDAVYEYDSSLYLYVDTRPNETTRGFVRMRGVHPDPNLDPKLANDAPPRFDLDESWIKLSVFERTTFVTFGRQHVKWGTGRFWNPSDFLAPSPKDPFAVYDYRLGTNLFKVHYPFEKEGVNLYGIIDGENLGRYSKPGAALRAEFTGSASEYSFTAYARNHKPSRLAGDFSLGLGKVDLHGELVFSTLNRQNFYKGDGSLSNPLGLETYSRKNRWIPQFVIGLGHDHLYSDQKHFTVEVEYFYNGLGYDNRDLELVSLVSRTSQPLYAGKHYAGVLFGLPNPSKFHNTSFYLTNLYNISDRSGLARISSQTLFFKEMLLELWASASYGREGELRFKVPAGLAPSQQPGGEPIAGAAYASGISRAVGASMSLSF